MSSPSPGSQALFLHPPRVAHPTPAEGCVCTASARSAGPRERAPGAPAGCRAARHSPMRLKLSDKVLRNFFILPIFSAGCGSIRSHIWATRGPGNFPKLVQSGALTTARERGAGKGAAAPPPPPPSPPAGRQRAGSGGERRAAGSARAWAAAARAGALYVVPGAAAHRTAWLIFPPL